MENKKLNYSVKELWEMLDDPMLEKAKKEVLKYPAVLHGIKERFMLITMKNEKEKISMTEKQFKEMMESDSQIYMINDKEGNFTNKGLNKTEIKSFDVDAKKTNDFYESRLLAYAQRLHKKILEQWSQTPQEEKNIFTSKEEETRKRIAKICEDWRRQTGRLTAKIQQDE